MLTPSLRVRVSLCLLFVGCAFAAAACKSEKSDDAVATDQAVASAGPAAQRAKHQLPAAAYDACTGKAAGDACSVQLGSKQIEAKCAAMPDSRLACRPERPEHKKPEGS